MDEDGIPKCNQLDTKRKKRKTKFYNPSKAEFMKQCLNEIFKQEIGKTEGNGSQELEGNKIYIINITMVRLESKNH